MKPAIEIIDPINVESHAAVATDPWQGISEDVIRRFVDVLRSEQALPKAIISTYRADLDALDRWLIETKQRTLISATDEDVREYISVSLSCLRAFYGFLVNAGCRDDDPTEPGRAPRSASALQRDREH
jgi:site-specific recombinase XerD